jgi:hypothetical protein
MSILKSIHLGEAGSDGFIPSIPVSCAVLCVDCERITVSYNDACPVCGSRSLLNVAQILGGTLTGDRVRPVETPLDIARCA